MHDGAGEIAARDEVSASGADGRGAAMATWSTGSPRPRSDSLGSAGGPLGRCWPAGLISRSRICAVPAEPRDCSILCRLFCENPQYPAATAKGSTAAMSHFVPSPEGLNRPSPEAGAGMFAMSPFHVLNSG